MNTQKDSLLFFFFLCSFSISRKINEQKISKFEREVKSNGNILLPHRFFFPFTRFFLWTLRKIPYSFFLCPVSISRIINAKKTRNPRRKSRAMETHFYPIEFFFLFTRFFLWTLTKIPYPFFLCLLSISRIMNAKKKLEIREGSQDQWKHTSTP